MTNEERDQVLADLASHLRAQAQREEVKIDFSEIAKDMTESRIPWDPVPGSDQWKALATLADDLTKKAYPETKVLNGFVYHDPREPVLYTIERDVEKERRDREEYMRMYLTHKYAEYLEGALKSQRHGPEPIVIPGFGEWYRIEYGTPFKGYSDF